MSLRVLTRFALRVLSRAQPLARATSIAIVAACATPRESEVVPIYRELRSDLALDARHAIPLADLMQRQRQRELEVKRLAAAEELDTAEDRWMAAAVLLESDDIEMLQLAQRLALEAADMGSELGKRVAAEALDRELVKRGMAQRYGTQFYYDEFTSRWKLYPVDPRTTDAERRDVGVAPLADLEREAERLNGG